MINSKTHFLSIFIAGASLLIGGCTSQEDIIDDIEKGNSADQARTCQMIFNGSKVGYDDEPETRSATTWANGDKIYLTLTSSSNTIYGDAVYSNGNWSLNYYGTLSNGASGKCTAVYFENAEYESGSSITLSENTGIYEETAGTFTYTGDALSVTANLKPKTGRIRFKGTNNESITICGITHYDSYNYKTGAYTTSSLALSKKVSSSYTPYIYGMCTDETTRAVNVITSASGFTRSFPKSIFNAGESGYMTIPTTTSYSGWQNSVTLKVNGVEFTMIPVKYSSGNFLLAETETTEQLYVAVTGKDTSYNSNSPKRSLSASSWESFISKLSDITNLKFRMPTKAEWQWAAKGGERSKGYTYSGSNILSEVGWYISNSSSRTHEVKQLKANELGFYDMSGNVAELTSDTDDSYYKYNYTLGGYYSGSESYCAIAYEATTANIGSTYYGLRIALSNK